MSIVRDSIEDIREIDGKATSSNPSFTGSITEEVAVCDLVLEPDNGTVQTYTATGDFTLTDGLAEGQSMILRLTNGGWTTTFPTIVWINGSEPTLTTTDDIVFYKIDSNLCGAYIGSVVA